MGWVELMARDRGVVRKSFLDLALEEADDRYLAVAEVETDDHAEA
jgi:hypothetical protein